MNWLDIVLLIIVIGSVVASVRKGFSRELISLVSVILALMLGLWFYGTAAGYLARFLSSRAAANLAGFLVVFCAVVLVGSLTSWIVGKFLKVTGLSIFDHLLGAGFGLVRGVLISVALIMGVMAFSPDGHPPGPIVHSRLAPYAADAGRAIVSMAPHELKEGYRRTYAQVKSAWAEALKKGGRGVPGKGKKENEREI